MNSSSRKWLLAAALALCGAACDESLSDVAGPTPDLEPTFTSIQREIFNVTDSSGRLACIQCHNDNGRVPAGNLVLLEGRSYTQLVGRASSFKAGATLAGSFLASGLVDELLLYVAPVILGSHARPLFDGLDVGQMSERMRMRIVESRRLGEDVRVLLEPAPAAASGAPA